MEVIGVFAVLMVLQSLMSMNFFLNICKLSKSEWFNLNVCAPSCFIFGAGYVLYYFTSNPILMFAITGNLLYFGGGGLLIFKYKGFGNFIAQVNHFSMVSSTIALYYDNFATGNLHFLAYGCILAMVVHTIWGNFHADYLRKNPELFDMLMKLDVLDFKVVQELGVKEAFRQHNEEGKKDQ